MSKKYRSFKFKLSIIFCIVQIIVIIFVGVIHYFNVRNILYEDYTKNQNFLEDKIISSVRATDASYYIIENNLLPEENALADKIVDDYTITKNIENINLKKYINSNTSITINILDSNFKNIMSTDMNSVGKDYSKNTHMDMFLRDAVSKKIFMNDRIYVSNDGEKIEKPFYKATSDGNYVISIVIDMAKYLDVLKLANQDFNHLYESLSSIDENLKHMEIFSMDGMSFGSKSGQKDLKELFDNYKPYIKKAAESNKTINLYKNYYGNRMLYKFLPYKMISRDSNNVIYIEYDNSQLNKKLMHNLLITVLSMMVAFIIATVFGIIANEYITKPINKIFLGIKNISNGNFAYKLNVDTNDEFGILGDKFNEMIMVLEDLNEEREAQSKEIIAQKDEISALYQQTNAMNKELFNLLDKQKVSYISTVKALANAIEAKDKYTEGHCKRVTKYCLAIAKEMKLSDEDINNIHFASLLHDIGKIGIPSSIINKNGKLTEEEYKIIKRHPQIGYDILKNVEFLKISNEIILQHHERIDGKGYPNSLENGNITLLGKILAVADSYDAMTSSRPYRFVPLTMEQALLELENNIGTQFDDQVVEVFIKILMKE